MLNHTEATLKIFFTTEYSRFNMINGNRQLNDGRIKKIMREIAEGNDMLKYYPIQVKENGHRLDILDGQHRFYICKKLKRPVFYILITEQKTLPEIAKINSNVEKWKDADFINCYVQNDNENYKTLQNYLDTYGISVGSSLSLLALGTPKSNTHDALKEKFHHGQFEVKFSEYANELAEDCKRYAPFFWRDRNFVSAIHKIKKAGLIDIAEVLEAFRKRPELLLHQSGIKEYVYNLEQIVNVKKQIRIVIV